MWRKGLDNQEGIREAIMYLSFMALDIQGDPMTKVVAILAIMKGWTGTFKVALQ